MNREDIQMWATQAQLPQDYETGEAMWLDRLERFAALVAAAERKALHVAITNKEMIPTLSHGVLLKLSDVADAIRAKGQA